MKKRVAYVKLVLENPGAKSTQEKKRITAIEVPFGQTVTIDPQNRVLCSTVEVRVPDFEREFEAERERGRQDLLDELEEFGFESMREHLLKLLSERAAVLVD